MFDANDFGMFTDRGNSIVANLVDRARRNRLSWKQVYQELCRIGDQPETGEATDTAVREAVYYTLGFHKTDEAFYC